MLPACLRWRTTWLMSSCIQVPRIRARTEDLPLWNTSPTKQQPWPEGNSSLVLICLTVHFSGLFFCLCLFCLFFYSVPVSRPALFMNPLCSFCTPGNFQLWGQSIQVDWAEPEKNVEEEVMQRVRVVYVSPLITEEMTEEYVSTWSGNRLRQIYWEVLAGVTAADVGRGLSQLTYLLAEERLSLVTLFITLCLLRSNREVTWFLVWPPGA